MSSWNLALVAFWLIAAIPFTAFIGYPMAIRRLGRRLPALIPPAPPGDDQLPVMALVIAAYHEEAGIAVRLENALAVDYPPDRYFVVIATDGSRDGTDAIVERFVPAGVRLVRSAENRGKSAALNDAILIAREAGAEVLLFSDANTQLAADAPRRMAAWFLNSRIGCVCGRLVYTDGDSTSDLAAVRGEQRYWSWDTAIKAAEGRSGCLLGGNGAIFALRAELAVPLPAGQSNDMVWPIWARRCGFAAVYEPDALAWEPPAGSVGGEYRRRVRIIARGLSGVAYCLSFLLWGGDPFPSRVFLVAQLLAKKLSRYLAVPALAGMIVCGAFAPGGLTLFFARCIVLAIVAAASLAGLHMLAGRRLRGLPDPRFVLAMSAASLVGLFHFLTGTRHETWRSSR